MSTDDKNSSFFQQWKQIFRDIRLRFEFMLFVIHIYIYIYINIINMRGKKDATTFPDKPVS